MLDLRCWKFTKLIFKVSWKPGNSKYKNVDQIDWNLIIPHFKYGFPTTFLSITFWILILEYRYCCFSPFKMFWKPRKEQNKSESFLARATEGTSLYSMSGFISCACYQTVKICFWDEEQQQLHTNTNTRLKIHTDIFPQKILSLNYTLTR